MSSPPSSGLGAGSFHDRRPLVDLALDEARHLGRRHRAALGADLLPALDDRGLLQHRLHLGRQPVDDRLRRLRGHRDAEPGVGDQVRVAQLLHRRHVGKGGAAGLAAHRQRIHLAGLDVRRGRRQRIEHHRHVAGDRVDHGRAGAAIGNVDQARADHLFETRAEQMVARAGAGGRIGDLSGIGLGVVDELLEGLGLEVRIGDEHAGVGRGDGNVDEVAHRIEVAAAVERGRDRQARDHRHQERVAVGGRLGDDRGADHGALAGLVVDDDGLAELLAEILGDHARHDVGGAAGRIGHDELDGLAGPRRGLT